MRYQPRLKNGELVKMPWTLALYRRFNPLVWPMEENPSQREIYKEWIIRVFGFLVYSLQIEADFHYLMLNLHDLNSLLLGMPTFLVQVETIIRCIHLSTHKSQFRKLLQYFYTEIHVTKESDPQSYARIKRQMLGPRLLAFFYMATLMAFFYEPLKNIMEDRREMLYKQEYFFDSTRLPLYIPLICFNFWVGICIDTILFGELNLMGELMMHLNARYLELGKDLHQTAMRLRELDDATNIGANYHRELVNILRRNILLNNFAEQVEEQFTFRIFLTFSISAMILCSLGFLCYTDPANNVVCLVWFTAKLMELMEFGFLGSILYHTTDELSLMYYSSEWEQIVYRSNNVPENIKLMKMIILSIELNSKPIALTGLKYFHVTLSAVLTIIRGALSYFTFLTSMR